MGQTQPIYCVYFDQVKPAGDTILNDLWKISDAPFPNLTPGYSMAHLAPAAWVLTTTLELTPFPHVAPLLLPLCPGLQQCVVWASEFDIAHFSSGSFALYSKSTWGWNHKGPVPCGPIVSLTLARCGTGWEGQYDGRVRWSFQLANGRGWSSQINAALNYQVLSGDCPFAD